MRLDRRGALDFRHTSVEGEVFHCLANADLSDRQRLGLILQGAALLSHLEAVGCRLATAWRQMGLDREGLLSGAEIGLQPDPVWPQDHLLDLIEILFGTREEIIGKGQAKNLASCELRRWLRWPQRLPASRIVTRILDEARFLWHSRYSTARRALVAEVGAGISRRVLVAGRSSFARCLLRRQGGDRSELLRRVESAAAGRVWRRCAEVGAGLDPAMTPMARARRLYCLGRWREALRLLKRQRGSAARILEAECQRCLGRLAAAKASLDVAHADRPMTSMESIEHAEALAGLCLDRGRPDRARRQLAQLELAPGSDSVAGRTLLLAEVAARRADWPAVDRHLGDLTGLQGDPDRWWRRSRLMCQLEGSRHNRLDAERHAACALVRGRRNMPRHEAARLWSEVAVLRARDGALSSAEKAARHALRILEAIDERAASTVARLGVDLQLRQGRLPGAERWRAVISSKRAPIDWGVAPTREELLARRDLVTGQPCKAWERLESFLHDFDLDRSPRADPCRQLAARALGWMGRGAEARDLLDPLTPASLGNLEPEEIPALWALAGDWSRAREATANDDLGMLWRAVLAGEEIMADGWEALRSLGGYRAARLVFDLQVLVPGRVPRLWLDRAARTLRDLGSHAFAERLDRTRVGVWRALDSFLERSSNQGGGVGELFIDSGYFDTRLEWRRRETVEILVQGRGGDRELRAAKHGGELVLSTRSMDPIIKVLFALAVREFEPPSKAEGPAAARLVRGMLGESQALRGALARLERLAVVDVPVLIEGETGTGKELAARQLHRLSSRSQLPLVAVNCAALSEALLLADLFGHVRGAFTGADRDRAGIFESASGGTVLLDEIGDLPPAAQGKLLRVLQEGEVRRVGESLARRVDVRVVAATHRDLESMVREQAFRADLFYRLRVGSVRLPPLRQRGDDVLLLADEWLARAGRRLSPRARDRLLRHSWPGNVRELANVIQAAMALTDGSVIGDQDLELPETEIAPPVGYHRQVDEFRRQLVRQALAASGGRRTAAARQLAVSRQALSYLVRRFDLQ